MINSISPFSELPDDIKSRVGEQLEEVSYPESKRLYLQNHSPLVGLDIVVAGVYECYFFDSDQKKRRIEKYEAKSFYGGISFLYNKGISLQTVEVAEGTRVLRLPLEVLEYLCGSFPEFKNYFVQEFGKRMLDSDFSDFIKGSTVYLPSNQSAADLFYSQKVASLNPRGLVSIANYTPIFQVAEKMALEKTSCIFVYDQEKKIVGYVTDITLRDFVIAKQIPVHEPVGRIIETNLVSIDIDAYVYEALLLMFQTQTRYILLSRMGLYIGFISRNKLLSEQSQSPLVFIQSVKQATSLDELKTKWEQVPGIVHQLLERGVKPGIVNQIITAVSDTIALRVIGKVIKKSGPPPSRFVFITLGSEGRKEQTLKTDQDNAIIYEDKANEQRETVRGYFLSFAEQVSEALDMIGFSFCKGNFMAKNPKWTHSLSHWKRNYDSWMTASTEETVMKYSTFFDKRAIYGDFSILDDLHQYMNEQLQAPLDRFFMNMASNALRYEPPLTFYRGIKTFTLKDKKVFDIKKAMTPIVDLTRVYALKHRIFETNTGERLKILAERGLLTQKNYQELRHAYYYLMAMRLDNQATQIINEKTPPTNMISLDSITKIEKVALVEVFKIIKDFQLKVKVEFTNSLF